MNKLKLIGAVLAVELLGGAVAGDVVSVPGDYPTVLAAVQAANGDTSHWTINVGPGDWTLGGVNILQPLLLISTDGAGATSLLGFSIDVNATTDVRVAGFTITTGPGSSGNLIIISGKPIIEDCVFDNGKVTIRPSGSGTLIRRCSFVGTLDGGVRMETSNAMIVDCSFTGNATSGGQGRGGAIYANAASTIASCSFENNTAEFGGAIYWTTGDLSDVPRIFDCSFRNNTATFGGAIYLADATSPVIANCLMAGNEATFGGAIFNAEGFKTPTLVNCTIAGNVAAVGAAIANDDFVVLTIWNSIIWFNDPDQIVGDPLSATEVMFSNFELPQFGGPGTISSDPLFVDLVNGDVHLGAGSPSIDAAHNWLVPIDSIDLDQDADSSELLPLDLDGNPRFANDPATVDTGCGASAVVDMGAYEFPGNALDCLRPGDVNGDGTVNVLDLIELLLEFGASCDMGCCLADFNTDGSVDVLDLIDLLLAFGAACP